MRIDFIAPEKPTQNPYVESFNGKLRDECLNEHWFTSVEDARRILNAWRRDYNTVRLHSSLKKTSPRSSLPRSTGTPLFSGNAANEPEAVSEDGRCRWRRRSGKCWSASGMRFTYEKAAEGEEV